MNIHTKAVFTIRITQVQIESSIEYDIFSSFGFIFLNFIIYMDMM